jgi:16S rRNA (cytidine1402-2'-O)-methyltransferase
MPGILDPGHHFINLTIQNNIPITVIPGSTAFICALVLSGKPAHKFIFEGFLPKKSVSRRRCLGELKSLNYTLVFYESCHRIVATLKDIQDIFGDIPLVVARELTKKFEETIRSKVSQIREDLTKGRPRGEFVVVI